MSSSVLEILDCATLKTIGNVGYGEYNGTSDTVPSEFVVDYESEMQGQRPYFLGWNECICSDKFHQGVILFSRFGGGFFWPSKACMKCKCITGVTSPYESENGYTPLSGDEKKFWKDFHAEGWPKDGDPRESDALSA